MSRGGRTTPAGALLACSRLLSTTSPVGVSGVPGVPGVVAGAADGGIVEVEKGGEVVGRGSDNLSGNLHVLGAPELH